MPVQQPHADQRHAEIAAGLEVVAGQDAQAAGVLRERGRDAELRREVGHCGRPACQLGAGLIPARAGQVLPQLVGGVAEPPQEAPVGGQAGQPLLRHLGQQGDRILPGPLPPVRIHGGKKIKRVGMP